MQCHSMLRLNLVRTGPEELPVQPLSGGGSEDPHGDGSHLYRHSKVKLQRRKAALNRRCSAFSNDLPNDFCFHRCLFCRCRGS